MQCWDSAGVEIACAGTGQDGELQRGAPHSYTINFDGTISDNVTGLMWEAKSWDGSVHDWSSTYTWDGAFAYVAELNAQSFAGYTDWRLPNINELLSLADFQDDLYGVDPTLARLCFLGCIETTCSCPSGITWSSTSFLHIVDPPFKARAAAGWQSFGIVKSLDLIGVRAVRGAGNVLKTGQTGCWDSSGGSIACAGTGQDGELQLGLARAYVDNGNGTITDLTTGLTWEYNGSANYTWDQAFAHVAVLNTANFAGYSDWRVPNMNDLASQTDFGQTTPALDPIFGGLDPGYPWSSTSYTFDPTYAFRMQRQGGSEEANIGVDPKTTLRDLHAVRGGL